MTNSINAPYLLEIGFSLICPTNDLESSEIVRIAGQYKNIDLRISHQGWGGKLGREPPENLKNLRKHLVVVELPDEHAEDYLRQQGHVVIVIDHHDYSGLNRWRPDSSLEQFCHLMGHPMTQDLWELAVNDRDFIPGLARLGLSYEKMDSIRRQEHEVRGISALFQEAFQKQRVPLRHLDDLDLFVVPIRYGPVMDEVAQWPDKAKYQAGIKEGSLPLRNCLLVYHEENNPECIAQVEFAGAVASGKPSVTCLKIGASQTSTCGPEAVSIVASGAPNQGTLRPILWR